MNKQAFLAGAGISVPPPAGLPTAAAFTKAILQQLSPDPFASSVFFSLLDPFKGGIRFEFLLDVIQSIFDRNLEVLNLYGEAKQPNSYHLFLASRAIQGEVVLTTNFDTLIEEAVLELGACPFTVASPVGFAKWIELPKSSQIPIFHLHGSLHKYRGFTRNRSAETVQATLTSVASAPRPFTLPRVKQHFLCNILNSANLTVIGYSGADDFDIMPSMSLVQPARVTWVIHSNRGKSVTDITAQILRMLQKKKTSAYAGRDSFFQSILKGSPGRLTVIKAPTIRFLKQAYGRFPWVQSSGPAQLEVHNVTEWANRWSVKIAPKKQQKLFFTGELLTRLGQIEAAERYLRAVWRVSGKDPELSIRTARGLSKLAIRIGKRTRAVPWARKALALLPSKSSPNDRVSCLEQLAFSLYTNGKAAKARSLYEKAITRARENRLTFWMGTCLHDLALLEQERGELTTAIGLYRRSIAASSSAGDIGHVAWSLHHLAICNYELGRLDKARKYLEQAINIAVLVGDAYEAAKLEHEFGLVEFLAGNIDIAIAHYRRGLKSYRRLGTREFRGIELQHLGEAFLEKRDLRMARRYLKAAIKELASTHDKETMVECHCYLSLYYLLAGQLKKARSAVRKAIRLQEWTLPQFALRAQFVDALVRCISSEPKAEEILGQAFQKIHRLWAVALVLDTAYWFARIAPKIKWNRRVETILRDAMKLYRINGNQSRGEVVAEFLKALRAA